MRALLVLYLSAGLAQGGFGWTAGQAIYLYGLYTATIFVTPVLGGYVGDKLLGPRRAIMAGCVLLMVGHALMALPMAIPSLGNWLFGPAAGAALDAAAVPGGLIVLDPAVGRIHEAAAAVAPGSAEAVAWQARLLYRLEASAFYLALTLIAVGTGFFKSNAYSLVSRLYPDDDRRRESGFVLYYISINIGAVAAALVVGTIGERAGWHAGFGAAGLGMLAGFVVLTILGRRWLGHVDGIAEWGPARHGGPLTHRERGHIKTISVLALFALLFGLFLEQGGGLLNIYAQSQTDRTLAGVEIPTTWFQTLNPIYVLLLSPAILVGLARAERRLGPISIMTRCSVALFVSGLGFAVMVGATQFQVEGKSGPLFLVAAYLLITAGEILFFPVCVSLVTRIAPRGTAAITLSVWMLSLAAGFYLAGVTGSLIDSVAPRSIFIGLTLVAALAAFVSLACGRFVHRWLGVPDNATPAIRPPWPEKAA
jgi:POT family proton-dependent oligopeptide transporter